MTSLLSVSKLTVVRQGKTVLREVDLEISSGEFVGLIGSNGAGKSTLLKSVLGLLSSTGEIRIADTDGRKMSRTDRAKTISYLAQEREINWPLKVKELIGLGGATKHNVSRAMHRLDVESLENHRATELSGGEKARVLVARALAQNTPLLLADEPVAGLDPAHQIRLMQEFSGLANDGKAIVACLHELSLASQYCTRLVVLDDGSVAANGSPETVLTDALLDKVYGITATTVKMSKDRICVPVGLSKA